MGLFGDGIAKVGSCKAQCEGAGCEGNAKANSRQTCVQGDVKANCIEKLVMKALRRHLVVRRSIINLDNLS